MLDQRKSIQPEETKEGQKARARTAEDSKGKPSLWDVGKEVKDRGKIVL